MNALNYPVWIEVIGEWQSLIGSGIALGSAWWAVTKVQHQIKLAEEQSKLTESIEAERLRRRFLAARATLPATLSAIISYSRAAAEGISHIYGNVNDSGEYPDIDDEYGSRSTIPQYTAPSVPNDMIAAVERMIEASNDHAVAELLADILTMTQVLNSRLRDLPRQFASSTLGLRMNLDAYLMQAAQIHAKSESLFRFARRQTETVTLRATWGDVAKALDLLDIREDHYPGVHLLIARKAEQNAPV